MEYVWKVEHPTGGAPVRLVLTKTQMFLGRGDWNDLVLPFDVLSAQHCAVLYFKGRFLLKDLGSSNGTYLLPNYQLANFDEIQPGQSFLLANLRVSFELSSALSSPVVSAPHVQPAEAVNLATKIVRKPLPKLRGPLTAELLGVVNPDKPASAPKRKSIFGLGG